MIFQKTIEKMYKNIIFQRCDDNGDVFYFSAKDFDSLSAEPFSFTSSKNYKLQGYFYSYEGYDKDRLVIFDHGFGGGHLAYMTEIEALCRHGYRVFSYDHTGCMESEGEGAGGLSQSLIDLSDAISAIKADGRYSSLDISVIGHSWGGISCLNISALHPEVSHIVAIAAPVSVKAFVEQNFSGILKGYRKCVYELERASNPKYIELDGASTLKNSSASILLIYSDNDPIVKKEYHYAPLEEALKDKENVKLLLVSGKGHNPHYTLDALTYMGEFFRERKRLQKKKALKTREDKDRFLALYDWRRMTAQDDEVFKVIFEVLDK